MHRFHYGVMAVALLAGTSLAIAQQEKPQLNSDQAKTQQNSADEALTRSAPEAKDPPQAPPHISASDQASQPGTQSGGQSAGPLKDGKLETSGAPSAAQQAQPGAQQGKQPGAQDEPAKFSAKNDQIDKTPIMAYPIPLTDQQKRAIAQHFSGAPVSNITAKPSEEVPATLALQELPQELAASMPAVRDYKFLRLSDRILVVNPRESIVVGEIAGN